MFQLHIFMKSVISSKWAESVSIIVLKSVLKKLFVSKFWVKHTSLYLYEAQNVHELYNMRGRDL